MTLKYLPDNSNIWFISCWYLLVAFFHSGCDCSGSQWNEWVSWIFWILYYKTLNSTSSFLVCILPLRCSKRAEWVYIFSLALCKCGTLIHSDLWQMGGVEVQFHWVSWNLTSAGGALGQTDVFLWEIPADTRGLVVPSVHHFFPPLDVSSLLDPLTLEWGCEAEWWWDSLSNKSRPHWYHLGRAVKAPSAFVGQKVNYQLPTKPCRHPSGRRSRNFACFSQVRVGRLSHCLALLTPLAGEIEPLLSDMPVLGLGNWNS